MKSIIKRVYSFLDSSHFFSIILLFFLFEAVWIAVSAAYPQAFDENFHFGLIKVYSHYWLPFLSHQPANANAYGAVARDPSYLYHYLMSFPYRIIALVIHGQIGQVIALRFINIGLFATGLLLFRRVLVRVGMSRSLANCSILVFSLIPIAPQLAAQITYDNLLFPLVAWSILMTFTATDQLRARKPSARTLLSLLSLCILTSLVKYAFMPIFLGIVVFLSIVAYKAYHFRIKQLGSHIWKSWLAQSKRAKILLVIVTLISIGLFIQRDGVNLIEYHKIQPNCQTVLSVKACSAYSPWFYNYNNHNTVLKGHISFTNPVSYTLEWFYWMWYRLFFAVNGPTSGFKNYPPLPLPSAAAILLAASGAFATVRWRRRIFKGNIYMVLLFVVSALYVLALMAQGYSTYRYTDVLENMNGRYLLPILLFVAAIIGKALSIELRNSSSRKVIFVVAIVVLFLQGGGIFTFIARSDNTWDVNNTAVVKVNNAARHITNPVLVNGKENYSTKLWVFN
jgi:hypothetical protein